MHSHLNGHPALIEASRRLENLGVDQFELYLMKKTATQVESKDLKVEALTREEDVGLSIRLVKDQRLGFAFTTSMNTEAVEKAVQAASDIASVMPRDEFVTLRSFGEVVYPEVDLMDPKGLEQPVEKKIELARLLESECKKADRRIQGVRSASLKESFYEIHMVDTHGEHIQHRGTLYSGSITCKAEDKGDSQMGGNFGFSNSLEGLDVGQIGREAAVYATELLGAGNAPTLKCPAVFRHTVMVSLLEFLTSSFNAEEVDKGRSMLADKKGERIFSEHITLINDGLLPGGYGTSPFDGEGTPSCKTTLVDGGFLASYLYNSYYAKKMGADSTSSSQRGIKSPPSIGVSNFYMQKGKKSPKQLLQGIKTGVYITDLMGMHTANPVTGDFSLGASGLLIENGEITRPVKGFAIAGNILTLLKNVTDIGSDLRFFGSVGAPSVRFAEISVGGN